MEGKQNKGMNTQIEEFRNIWDYIGLLPEIHCIYLLDDMGMVQICVQKYMCFVFSNKRWHEDKN